MRVDPIILLIAIIGVVENRAAPNAGVGSTCGDFKGRYLFVLTPAANRIDVLNDLVKLAQSAIVKSPEIEGDPVHVVISPEDFTEFEKKSRALKVYRSHSLQCVDQTTNLEIVERNSSRAALPWPELRGKTNENSSLEVITPLTPKTTEKLSNKMCKTLNICEPEFKNNLINASLSNDGNKLSNATAPPNTTFDDSMSSRIVRASKTKKGTSKPKSKGKTATKFRSGKSRAKPKERRKKSRKNTGKKSAKKVTKTRVANRKTTSIPVPKKSTQESWNKLMRMAAKSLTKEVKSPNGVRKLLSSPKPANVKKSAKANKIFSSQTKRLKTKNTRKPAKKMSSSAKKRMKTFNARNRVNQQRKTRPKSQGSRKSSDAVNPKVVVENGTLNRDSRELKISAETRCVENNSEKRSLRHLAKRGFTFRAPGGCTVIRISNSCDDHCSENKGENSGDMTYVHRQETLNYSTPTPQLFLPIDSPADTVPEDLLLPNYLGKVQGKSREPANMIFGQNSNPYAGEFEGNAAPPQSLLPESSPADYESQEKHPNFESVNPNDYDEWMDVEEKLTANSPTTDPWFEDSGFIPPSEKPYEAQIEPEEDIEDADNFDEDDKYDYDDDDDDDYEEEHYEELEGYEEEEKSEIPGMLASVPPSKAEDEEKNGQDEDYDHMEEDYENMDEDYDDMDDNFDDMDDNFDDDDDFYVEENGNAGIGDEDDYNED